MENGSIRSRVEASFLCLAVTDALGGPLEFQPRRNNPVDQVTEMLPNGNFGLGPGHFTDDTSMALCLASSLLETRGKTDPLSQARAYATWFREGWMSSVPGRCFDIGIQTTEALAIWEHAINASSADDTDGQKAVADVQAKIKFHFDTQRKCGNGSLMRVLPCILVASSIEQAVQLARESSSVTHPYRRNADACEIYARLVYQALQGANKTQLFQVLHHYMLGAGSKDIDSELKGRFQNYNSINDFLTKPVSEISSSGYVVHTLEAALWSFFTTSTYREGAIRVVNLGDDADTVGAVYGGLAGAFYGHPNVIPKEWLDEMQTMNVLRGVIDRILQRFH